MKRNAIILAGGRSSRMGTNKALLRVGGVPLIRRQASALSALFDDVLISCKSPEEYEFLGLPVVRDEYKAGAALVGLCSGLRASEADFNFCIACDLPLVHAGLIEHMLAEAGGAPAVAPESERGLEPLYAVYRKGCENAITELVESGRYSLRDMLRHIGGRTIGREEVERICGGTGPFLNVNTLEDLKIFESLVNEEEQGL